MLKLENSTKFCKYSIFGNCGHPNAQNSEGNQFIKIKNSNHSNPEKSAEIERHLLSIKILLFGYRACPKIEPLQYKNNLTKTNKCRERGKHDLAQMFSNFYFLFLEAGVGTSPRNWRTASRS